MALKIDPDSPSRRVMLSRRGLALCHFAFRDGPKLGLSDAEAYKIAKELIAEWDGSKSLLEIYREKQKDGS